VAVTTVVRDLRPGDWPQVSAIYLDGIRTGNATFETVVPSWEDWDAAHHGLRLAAELDGGLAGWATLTPISERECYRGVAEDSIYVGAASRGRGVGRVLLEELLARADAAGFWTVEAGIFPENTASVRLHLVCGFRIVGVRERLGRMDGVWRDVLLLERRSEIQ
jgi:phosphinothricin acetyltransferase